MGSLESLLNLEPTNLEFIPVFINFALCIAMSFIARSFYISYSTSLTGKYHIGNIIPILSAIVFLVILIVKSSLALSLGLVGALSIVRFRTPIKEPEELVYLFLSIAIGLGYAAGYGFITTALTSFILAFIYFWLSNRSSNKTEEYNLIVTWKNQENRFNDILENIEMISDELRLIRLNKGPINSNVVLMVTPREDLTLDSISTKLEKINPNIEISFFESKTNW